MKPHYYWSKERCLEEALKYKTRKEFSDNSSSAYTLCLKKKWIEEACSHMKIVHKPKNYWNKERWFFLFNLDISLVSSSLQEQVLLLIIV